MPSDSEFGPIAGKHPISTHPAFPVIVSIWFAALLGLGSLILPIVLLEKLVAASGIAAVFPPAAPPLGFTARTVIALAAAAIGGAGGFLLARRLAAAHRIGTANGRPPINAMDELGDEGLDAVASVPSRRRSLTVDQDVVPADEPLRAAFLPAQAAEEESPFDEPLELIEAEDEPSPWLDDEDAEEPEPLYYTAFEDADADAPENAPMPEYSPPSEDRHAPAAGAKSAPMKQAFARLEDVRALSRDFPGEAEPLPAASGEERARIVAAPLEELGLTQLVQRLGASIQQHREHRMQAAAAASSARAGMVFEAAPATEALRATAAYFGAGDMAPPPPFASFPPPEDEDEEAGEHNLGAFLPYAPYTQAGEARDGQAAPLRAFDPPGSASMADSPLTQRSTDEALRNALAKLQQLSGSA